MERIIMLGQNVYAETQFSILEYFMIGPSKAKEEGIRLKRGHKGQNFKIGLEYI